MLFTHTFSCIIIEIGNIYFKKNYHELENISIYRINVCIKCYKYTSTCFRQILKGCSS